LGSDIRKQPRPMGETWKSVVPKVRYSIRFASPRGAVVRPDYIEVTTNGLLFVAFGCRRSSVYDKANRPTIPGVRIQRLG